MLGESMPCLSQKYVLKKEAREATITTAAAAAPTTTTTATTTTATTTTTTTPARQQISLQVLPESPTLLFVYEYMQGSHSGDGAKLPLLHAVNPPFATSTLPCHARRTGSTTFPEPPEPPEPPELPHLPEPIDHGATSSDSDPTTTASSSVDISVILSHLIW